MTPKLASRALAVLAIAMGALVGAGCVAAPEPAAAVRVARATGSRQCEGGGASLDEMRRRLETAGVTVRSAQCATDGRMHPALCGAADGRMGLFEIDAAGLAAAQAQGFQPLAEGSEVRAVPCP